MPHAAFSDVIQGNPTVSADFKFNGPRAVVASTWKQPGSAHDKVPVTVGLEEAFARLPPATEWIQTPCNPSCGRRREPEGYFLWGR
jgi:hypothetical protein